MKHTRLLAAIIATSLLAAVSIGAVGPTIVRANTTSDVASLNHKQKILVYVRVVDPAGAGVQDVTVVHLEPQSSTGLGQRNITDAKGYASFLVPAHNKGRFMVMHEVGDMTLEAGVAYQTKDARDAGSIYTLRLSDGILRRMWRLRGREVVVRVYKDWDLINRRYAGNMLACGQPAQFEKVSLALTAGMLFFNLPEDALGPPGKTYVVLLGEDQTDTVVRTIIAESIYAQPYKPQLKLDMGTDAYLNRSRQVTFTDALGNPMAGALVEIYLSDYQNPTKVPVRQATLDDKGRLNVPRTLIRPTEFTFIVSDPCYGKAIIQNVFANVRERIIVPVAKIGTEADLSSIWGTVVDPNGSPVRAATVSSTWAVTPGGGNIHSSSRLNTSVLTDEQGHFRVHLPLETRRTELTRVPPICDYKVSVLPPQDMDLIPYSGDVPNGQETTIVLDPIEGQFRTFAFEDANGPITDSNILEQIRILIEEEERLKYAATYRQIKNRKKLPPGKYRAGAYGTDIPEFEPMEVSAKTPEHLVFKMRSKDGTLYRGRVVDGVTGLPMPGTFVVAKSWPKKDLSVITDNQWQQLHRLPLLPSPNDPALEPLRQVVRLRHIVRTDDQGLFQVQLFLPENSSCEIVAFEQDYMATRYTLEQQRFVPDTDNTVDLPDMCLYPAATVVLEPNVGRQDCEIRTRLKFSNENQPAWFKNFRKFWSHKCILKGRLEPDKAHSMLVPADLNLQICLQIADRSYRHFWWYTVLTENINASQGQVVNLGTVQIREEMPIFALVVDSAGTPLEGITVTHLDSENLHRGRSRITDEHGFAEFRVPPYYQGKFAVGPPGPARDRVLEAVTYQTNGPDDANTVYTLELSDKMLESLFK